MTCAHVGLERFEHRKTLSVQLQTHGGFAIDIVFDTFTPRGHAAVVDARSSLVARTSTLLAPASWTVRWLPSTPALLGPTHVRHAMRWVIPASWGRSDPMVRRQWKLFIDEHIIDVDQLYSDIAQELIRWR